MMAMKPIPATALLGAIALAVGCASSRAKHVSTEPGPPGHSRGDHYDKDFDDPERWASVFDDPERDGWQKPKHVIDLLDIPRGGAVADVGAGTGYFAPHLSRAVGPAGRVLAVDIEPSLVEYMNGRFDKEGLDNVETILAEPTNPELEPYSVDRILIVNTWHHIPARPTYGQRLYDALVAGGRLLVVDYTMDSPTGPPRQHRIPPEVVVETLEAAGFIVEIVDEDLPRQYAVAAEKPEA